MAKQVKLNGRLAMIADQIPECGILTDIGTDHAYIPIYAAEKGLCRKAIAADLRKGPLDMAEANIRRHGLEGRVETRLGNGLEPLVETECDVIVVAGMGGVLIRDILDFSFEKAKSAGLLLLQPNNAADVLRKWLLEKGFSIESELLALDAGKIYLLMRTMWTGRKEEREIFDYYIGRELLNEKGPLLQEYLRKKMKELDVVIIGRSISGKNKAENPVQVENPKRNEKRNEGGAAGGNGVSLISGMSLEECVEIRNRLERTLAALNRDEAGYDGEASKCSVNSTND